LLRVFRRACDHDPKPTINHAGISRGHGNRHPTYYKRGPRAISFAGFVTAQPVTVTSTKSTHQYDAYKQLPDARNRRSCLVTPPTLAITDPDINLPGHHELFPVHTTNTESLVRQDRSIPGSPISTSNTSVNAIAAEAEPSEVRAALSKLDPETATPAELAAIFRAPALKCETSNASPHIINVYGATNWLIKTHGSARCWQKNFGGTKCSRRASVADAQLSICGKYEGWLECDLLAWAAKHISNSCRWPNGKTGGWYDFPHRKVWVPIH
jgi:hypothetical protein